MIKAWVMKEKRRGNINTSSIASGLRMICLINAIIYLQKFFCSICQTKSIVFFTCMHSIFRPNYIYCNIYTIYAFLHFNLVRKSRIFKSWLGVFTPVFINDKVIDTIELNQMGDALWIARSIDISIDWCFLCIWYLFTGMESYSL